MNELKSMWVSHKILWDFVIQTYHQIPAKC